MVRYQPLFAPAKERFSFGLEDDVGIYGLVGALKSGLDPTTFLLMGAIFQTIAFSLLPFRYAAVPALLLTIFMLLDTILQSTGLTPNRQMKGVITGRTVTQLPSAQTLSFTGRPASEPVVVFLLGARSNHPLGIFAPNFKELGDHFTRMYADARANADTYGLLGASQWDSREGLDSLGNGRVAQGLSVFYFRSVDGLNAFAKSKLHVDGVRWWSEITRGGQNQHIGIMHETFEVPAGSWETIYENFQPTLMGETSMRVREEGTGEEKWARPVFAMGKGQFRTQYGRMGRTDGADNEKHAADGFF